MTTDELINALERMESETGLERCVKAMVVLGFVGIAAAVAYVAA